MAVEKIIKIKENNEEQFTKEFNELEKQRNEEVNSILSNKEYINWLLNFLNSYPSFIDDSLYFSNNISKTDKINLNKLKLLYKGIDKYCKNNYLYPTLTEYGKYYKIKYNDITFIIGYIIGENSYYYSKKIDGLDNCIDFDNILNHINIENIESIKIDLKKLSNQIKLLYEYGIPTLAIKECVDNTLNEIEENKTLRKTIKL